MPQREKRKGTSAYRGKITAKRLERKVSIRPRREASAIRAVKTVHQYRRTARRGGGRPNPCSIVMKEKNRGVGGYMVTT